MTIKTEWRDYDVAVGGSGGAGSLAARVAADEGAGADEQAREMLDAMDAAASRRGPRR